MMGKTLPQLIQGVEGRRKKILVGSGEVSQAIDAAGGERK
jgi:hypothetical protein